MESIRLFIFSGAVLSLDGLSLTLSRLPLLKAPAVSVRGLVPPWCIGGEKVTWGELFCECVYVYVCAFAFAYGESYICIGAFATPPGGVSYGLISGEVISDGANVRYEWEFSIPPSSLGGAGGAGRAALSTSASPSTSLFIPLPSTLSSKVYGASLS